MNDQQVATNNPFEQTEAWEPYLDRYIREEGNYVLTIKEADGQGENGTTSNGNPQIFIQLEGQAGSIRDWVIYHSQNLAKVVGIFTAAGVKLPQPGEFDPEDKSRLTDGCIARLVGRKVGTVDAQGGLLQRPVKDRPARAGLRGAGSDHGRRSSRYQRVRRRRRFDVERRRARTFRSSGDRLRGRGATTVSIRLWHEVRVVHVWDLSQSARGACTSG